MAESMPFASFSGDGKLRESDSAARSSTFMVGRRRHWPTAIGRILSGRGCKGRSVAVARKRRDTSGIMPRANHPTSG